MEYNIRNEIILRKGKQVYIFRYTSGGDEVELLDEIMRMAQEGSEVEGGFDYFDAAVISHTLIKSLLEQADRILKKGLPSLLQ
jgi:phosphatidylserine/phosphatidylglycerophosphate/cardiolipin synthase-like enzyme